MGFIIPECVRGHPNASIIFTYSFFCFVLIIIFALKPLGEKSRLVSPGSPCANLIKMNEAVVSGARAFNQIGGTQQHLLGMAQEND